MLHKGLYIQALLAAFVETSERVFSYYIDHSFGLILVLVLSLLVLGEYFPKANSYMVSERREILVT